MLVSLVPVSQGQNVAKLHASLALLGFEIAGKQRQAQRFGMSTQEALREFQHQRHLRATGTPTARTIAALDEAVRAVSLAGSVAGSGLVAHSAYQRSEGRIV